MRELALALIVAGLLQIGFVASAAADGTPSTTFEYLYIESNEGSSSGGHVAIRFESEIYHFQNRDQLLMLDRERSHEFLFDYALLNNRTVHVSEIAVEQEVADRLVRRFRGRFAAQTAQLSVRDALRRDLRALDNLDAPRVSVRGYGYFDSSNREHASSPSVALQNLRREITARYGPDFVVRRRSESQRDLELLTRTDPSGWPLVLPTSEYDHPAFARPWSSQLADLAAGFAALEMLENPVRLDPKSVFAPRDPVFRLTDEEQRVLVGFIQRLESDLVDLVASRREDWGETALIGMARLAALEASVGSGHFVFLDPFSAQSETVDTDTLQRRKHALPMMLDETGAQLASARGYFARADEPGELAWERVEERLVRHHELLRAVRGEQDLRLAKGHLIPERSALYSLPALTLRTEGESELDLSTIRSKVRDRQRDYARRLRRLHRYGLMSRNCVTEIFETLNAEFGESPQATRVALGGVVPGPDLFDFVPFVSAHQVNQRYRVLARYTLLSYREARMEAMRVEEGGIWWALRESNTLTAKSYRRAERDSFFIFFTERPVWLRPILGAVNLVAALSETSWGLIKLPVDRGRTLMSGLKGTFLSLPELAFANIRKGSNDWVPPEYREFEFESIDFELASRPESESPD